MRSHLRLVQTGDIATSACTQTAQHTQVPDLGGTSQAAQFEQFRKADQRFRIDQHDLVGALPGSRFMGRHTPPI
jgi:hypothetical protein